LLSSHQTSRSRCDMSVGTCHQSRARHAGWVFFSDHLSTSTYPVHQPYSTCTSSRAPAPHARSPLRTHDEHLSKENLLAVSLLTNIPRTSAGPLNAILEDQLAYLATPPQTLRQALLRYNRFGMSATLYTLRLAGSPCVCPQSGAFPYRAT